MGVDDTYQPADEGGGARDLPPISGHADFARYIGHSLMAEEFDLAFFGDRPLDHGCFSPLSLVNMTGKQWIVPIVPLQVGVLQYPIPTARRCYRLGRALRRAVLSYPEDIRVAVVGTGGLSHQVHGERSGFNNPDWDMEFLELIDPAWRARFRENPERHMEEAGLGSVDRDLILRSDWRGLIHRGATFFVLEKLGVVTGVGNLDIYAGMKDITIEEMLATRNEQITYSVAGKSSS